MGATQRFMGLVRRGGWSIFVLLSAGILLPRLAAADPAVAEFRDPAWSSGESVRSGATEMAILMRVALLRQDHPLAGLVCIGNRDGAFHASTEDTLARVALMGVPVAKLAQASPMPDNPDDLFIEAGVLAPEVAKRLLVQCLARYGAPPVAADPGRPTPRELAAIRAKLALYQKVFDAAGLSAVALR
ncbi:MAG TPA: hypothetical protein VG838_12825 [Opitutaceae bacterium]|nr:hypothetical protein [Opitutaceae bacterium]